ncbi:CBR-LEC-5 protein [Ditylenchus destructor]|nr:CBR-LEC-5 protein [Ditylenchus destructor]
MSDIRAIGEGEHTIPYVLNTCCVISDGYCIHAIGEVAQNPQRIDIRQRLGESDCEYIQRHISIRFGDNPAIIFNTVDDEIIREQIIPCNPFKAGEHFDFRAYVDVPKGVESNQKDEKLLIFANRKLIGSFEIPYANECSNNVLISGSMSSLKIFRVTNYLLSSEHAGCWVGMNYGFTIKSRLDMAFIIKGSSGFIKIDKITDAYEDGRTCPVPPQFNMLQINIDYDKKSIILDSNDSGENGQNCDNFPLEKNEIVDLTVFHDEKSFRIFFNHEFYKEFPKKYDLEYDKTFHGARQIMTDSETIVITKTICYGKDDDYDAVNGVGTSGEMRDWPYVDLPEADDSD